MCPFIHVDWGRKHETDSLKNMLPVDQNVKPNTLGVLDGLESFRINGAHTPFRMSRCVTSRRRPADRCGRGKLRHFRAKRAEKNQSTNNALYTT